MKTLLTLAKFFISGNTKWWQEYGKIVLSYTTALKSILTTFIKIVTAFFPSVRQFHVPGIYSGTFKHMLKDTCVYMKCLSMKQKSCVCLEVNTT